MANSYAAALVLALALAAAAQARAADGGAAAPAARAEAERLFSGTRFKCEDGGELTALFAARDDRFGAIVDAGDGPHFLPALPWTGGPVKLSWTDGRRTLTWSPGVQILWVDGPTPRMCGRGSEHRH